MEPGVASRRCLSHEKKIRSEVGLWRCFLNKKNKGFSCATWGYQWIFFNGIFSWEHIHDHHDHWDIYWLNHVDFPWEYRDRLGESPPGISMGLFFRGSFQQWHALRCASWRNIRWGKMGRKITQVIWSASGSKCGTKCSQYKTLKGLA